jgi:hypothetical protein
MKYKLVKFNDGSFGARRYSWAPLLGGYKFLDLDHPTGVLSEWSLPLSHCKGTKERVLEATRKATTKPAVLMQDLGTPC